MFCYGIFNSCFRFNTKLNAYESSQDFRSKYSSAKLLNKILEVKWRIVGIKSFAQKELKAFCFSLINSTYCQFNQTLAININVNIFGIYEKKIKLTIA